MKKHPFRAWLNAPEGQRPGPYWKDRRELVLLSSVLVVLALLCILVWNHAARVGGRAALEHYREARNETASSAYTGAYQPSFDAARRDYYESNSLTISVEGLKNQSALEVLQVSETAYVPGPYWLEVPGEGVYTVDLRAAEFITDSERQRLLVRLPEPELGLCTVRYGEVRSLRVHNGTVSRGDLLGEQEARQTLGEDTALIRSACNADPLLALNAREAAERIVAHLARSLNPAFPELTVEVEFLTTGQSAQG